MNKRVTSIVAALAVAGVTPLAGTLPASAADSPPVASPDSAKGKSTESRDDRPDALRTKHISTRQQALDQLATGRADLQGKGAKRTIRTAEGDTVAYPETQTAQLLTFLVQFGDDNSGSPFPDQTGPAANEIPEPPRSNNTTYWEPDFSSEHFKEMFFTGLEDQDGESFKDVYDEMSNGRFDLQGDVSDWVSVPKSAGSYNNASGQETQEGMTDYIQDTADAWYQSQKDAGKSDQEIVDYLQTFDIWDRYDYDGDGVTDEPDGYIDHFQAIHAGEGEEAGAPPWAIWSHRWAVNQDGFGTDGPSTSDDCSACFPLGGIQIGDTGYWIRDYTTEPENGGLGVFAHEFGHDLGLPDFYDTADGDNGTGYWTLMSSGSWLNHGKDDIGTSPNHMGPTEKMFLGWYGEEDLQTVDMTAGESGKVTLGPSTHSTSTGKQAVLVNLPDGTTEQSGPSKFGTGSYLYSGTRDQAAVTATSPALTVPAGGELTAKVWVDTETDFDYAYLQASTDGGTTFTNVNTSLSADTNPNGANLGEGMTGDTGGYVDMTADLSEYAGSGVLLRWEYITDENTHGQGVAVDELSVGDYTTSFDSATDWDLSGWFPAKDGKYLANYTQYYVAENRQYSGYDKTLATGPYSHDYLRSSNNKRVDHYAYQDGLLVWYKNDLYGDNNTIEHPGYGQALPVDSHPDKLTWSDGSRPNSRMQSYDATFDVDQTDPISLRAELPDTGYKTLEVPGGDGVTTFDDSDVDAYWDPENPWGSTKVAGTGTMIKVLSSDESTGKMEIEVGTKAPQATADPEISGTAQVGETLKASTGTWDLDDATFSYQWNADGEPIPGATKARYRLQPEDVGREITATVTATAPGSLPGMATSEATEPVAKAATSIKAKVPTTIKKGTRATAVLKVKAAFPATGRVTVKFGGKQVSKTLVNSKVRVRLPAIKKPGKYTLVAKYGGAAAFEKSSVRVTIRVK